MGKETCGVAFTGVRKRTGEVEFTEVGKEPGGGKVYRGGKGDRWR